MKEAKSKQEQPKRNAEDWVALAKRFGENCVAIQKDNNLTMDQKLQKQRTLSTEITKEIEKDAHLTKNDKQQMTHSIQSYIDEWQMIHDKMLKISDEKNKK